MLTVNYVVNGRTFSHSGKGEAFTRFLRKLNADGLKWQYADSKPAGSNLFAGINLKGK
jgi:hypothetical protein